MFVARPLVVCGHGPEFTLAMQPCHERDVPPFCQQTAGLPVQEFRVHVKKIFNRLSEKKDANQCFSSLSAPLHLPAFSFC